MKNNDLILIDSLLDSESKKHGVDNSDGHFFEFYCASQLLKNYDLSAEDIENGITDGKDDGGLDAIFCFANGQLLTDSKSKEEVKCDTGLEIIFITSKHADGFEQAVINSEYTTIAEFFDLSKDSKQLVCPYNDAILEKRSNILRFYKKNIIKITSLRIEYFYVSRGDENSVGENVQAKAEQLVILTKQLISNCVCNYTFIGPTLLLKKIRERKEFDIDLPISCSLSADKQKYIALCCIDDYFNFITNEDGELKYYLFDSNVRDYNGFNRTNMDIIGTLSNENDDADFWWLNNGITILSSDAYDLGSTIKIENVQIVNGLQTSYSIYKVLKDRPNHKDKLKRKIMVKIITETDPSIRDRIIRATNNQTSIAEQSLHATEKIQRDIEEILHKKDIYYERRNNYYSNQGIEQKKIITPLFLASGFFALIEKDIKQSITLKQKFMNDDSLYKYVYNDTPLDCWPNVAKIFQESEKAVLNNEKVKFVNAPSKLKTIRALASYIATSKYFNSYNYSKNDLMKLTFEQIENFDYQDVINALFESDHVFNKKRWKNKEQIDKFITYCSDKFKISNIESYTKRKHTYKSINNSLEACKRIYQKIRPFIPKQPWSENISSELAKSLKKKKSVISKALRYGIQIGDFDNQKFN